MQHKKIIFTLAIVAALGFGTSQAQAFHSWGSYHWARTSNPFTLKLGSNVTSAWAPILATASSDWTVSSVLDTSIVAGLSSKNCRPTNGRVEICNSKYGNNGWLGVAQIWLTEGTHISQGIVKLNDTYFTKPKYNTTAWKNLVMCQEIGHTFGLDHQDEEFGNANMNTCMDYTDSPAANQHPNAHDYEELEAIYAHTDSFTTIISATVSNIKNSIASDRADDHAEYGSVVRRDAQGKPSVYEKDLGKGEKLVTHIFWAE